jgi:hypothetical protein
LTIKVARRLNTRQTQSPAAKYLARFSIERQRKINPVLLKQLILVDDHQSIAFLRDYLLNRIEKHGEKELIQLINKYASKEINPGKKSRLGITIILRGLAQDGEEATLPGLLLGLKDSDKTISSWAIEGLQDLAEKGNKTAQTELAKHSL